LILKIISLYLQIDIHSDILPDPLIVVGLKIFPETNLSEIAVTCPAILAITNRNPVVEVVLAVILTIGGLVG
jgi:hypothetical protein